MPFSAFSYKKLLVGGKFPINLLDMCILGIAEALANITAVDGVDPVIKVTILL